MWFRDLDNKKIGAEVFGELQNVMLEENGEDKMVREQLCTSTHNAAKM